MRTASHDQVVNRLAILVGPHSFSCGCLTIVPTCAVSLLDFIRVKIVVVIRERLLIVIEAQLRLNAVRFCEGLLDTTGTATEKIANQPIVRSDSATHHLHTTRHEPRLSAEGLH